MSQTVARTGTDEAYFEWCCSTLRQEDLDPFVGSDFACLFDHYGPTSAALLLLPPIERGQIDEAIKAIHENSPNWGFVEWVYHEKIWVLGVRYHLFMGPVGAPYNHEIARKIWEAADRRPLLPDGFRRDPANFIEVYLPGQDQATAWVEAEYDCDCR